MTDLTHHLLASVLLPAKESLEQMAERLALLMPGFAFEDEKTGMYEEVPALVAQLNGMEFVLFGIPQGESSDEYELQFTCRTNSPIHELLQSETSGFVRQFVRDKEVNERGFLDFSEELAQVLVHYGIEGCRPVRAAEEN